MQDDFVCGSDYENCLDPTGKWIVNGEVVVGSTPDKTAPVDAEISTMLRNKIGVINDRGRPSGMCAAVMQKCQNYTMRDGKYNPDNALIAEYISRAIIQIKARRAALLDEYAQGCIADVTSCLGRNNNGASMNSDIAINSCMPVIKTCKSLTTGNAGDLDEIRKWLANVMGNRVVSNEGEMKPVPEPDKPDIPDTPIDLETIKQTDYERCRNIPGGRVSYSGTLCVIWNVSDSDSLLNLATSYGWAQLSYGHPNGFSSYLAGKSSFTETYDMYVMQWAYKEALNECESLGGALDFAPGMKRNNALAFCTIVMPPDKMPVTELQCKNLGTDWPIGAPGQTNTLVADYSVAETVNGVPTKVRCKFIHQGLYYVGKDLPGACVDVDGMEIMPDTGNCTCKPGFGYSDLMHCVEGIKNFWERD